MVAGNPLWPDLLEQADRDRLAARGGVSRPDVLVVGGGVLGVAAAAACRDAGLGVVQLIERDRIGGGATSGAAGMLTPDAHRGTEPDWFVELGRAGLARWRELDAGLPEGVGLVDVDWVGLDPRPPAWRPAAGAERLDDAAVAGLAPALARPATGWMLRGQARVNPLLATARLAGRLDHIATGVAASSVRVRGGRIVEVLTSAGPIVPGSVVFATGTGPELPGLAPPALPSGWVRGHLIATGPAPALLPTIVEPVGLPVDGGRIVSGGTLEPDEDEGVEPAALAGIEGDLRAWLPGLAGTPVTHGWSCRRPVHPDRLPLVERLLENAWVTSGHYRTGILMAPAVGEALAGWIASGVRPAAVAAAGTADRRDSEAARRDSEAARPE